MLEQRSLVTLARNRVRGDRSASSALRHHMSSNQTSGELRVSSAANHQCNLVSRLRINFGIARHTGERVFRLLPGHRTPVSRLRCGRLLASLRLGTYYDQRHVIVLLSSGSERVSGPHDAGNDLARLEAVAAFDGV